ncbi:transglutaminase family protein [Planctomycetales bacterium ZRK34]|nr:transglutaminase family protein [Planctomycetales bacterium ZRK34]
MDFAITHTITYRYSRPVFLEPKTVRLRPRCNAYQKLKEFTLDIDPAPAGRCDHIDAVGNGATLLWFSDLHGSMTITARSQVRTLLINPFDYLVTPPEALSLPMVYPLSYAGALSPYLFRAAPCQAVNTMARRILDENDDNTQAFVNAMMLELNREYEQIIRHEGDAWPAAKTIELKRGSCRDLAVLYIDACRSVGLAARFVSGYKHFVDSIDAGELHAWVEVYIPGAGWRGYDPSEGVVVADRHIALAADAEPAGAAPTTGTFRGTGATSHIDYHIRIDA